MDLEVSILPRDRQSFLPTSFIHHLPSKPSYFEMYPQGAHHILLSNVSNYILLPYLPSITFNHPPLSTPYPNQPQSLAYPGSYSCQIPHCKRLSFKSTYPSNIVLASISDDPLSIPLHTPFTATGTIPLSHTPVIKVCYSQHICMCFFQMIRVRGCVYSFWRPFLQFIGKSYHLFIPIKGSH